MARPTLSLASALFNSRTVVEEIELLIDGGSNESLTVISRSSSISNTQFALSNNKSWLDFFTSTSHNLNFPGFNEGPFCLIKDAMAPVAAFNHSSNASSHDSVSDEEGLARLMGR